MLERCVPHILKSWNLEHFETLKLCNFEIWSVDIWNFEISKIWNFEIIKLWNVETKKRFLFHSKGIPSTPIPTPTPAPDHPLGDTGVRNSSPSINSRQAQKQRIEIQSTPTKMVSWCYPFGPEKEKSDGFNSSHASVAKLAYPTSSAGHLLVLWLQSLLRCLRCHRLH